LKVNPELMANGNKIISVARKKQLPLLREGELIGGEFWPNAESIIAYSA